jgi:hypothetical protein
MADLLATRHTIMIVSGIRIADLINQRVVLVV